MSNASNYLEQQVFNHIFREATFSKPTNIAIGLTINDPSTAEGDTIMEVGNGNGYARIPGASGNNKWFGHGNDGPGANVVELSFSAATGDWGMVSGVIITDSPTYSGGNVLFQGALTSARDVKSGDTFRFSASGIRLTIT